MEIGRRLKQLRQAKDWTLADLAKNSGVALSSLSRIETGRMTGTLESHIQVVKCLGVRLSELYDSIDPIGSMVEHRPAGTESDKFFNGKGASFTILTAGALKKKMMPTLLTLQSKKSSQKEQGTTGSEKFLYLLKGKLQVTVGDQWVRMSPGDSLYFQASIPHQLKNLGSSPAVALSITCPPSV